MVFCDLTNVSMCMSVFKLRLCKDVQFEELAMCVCVCMLYEPYGAFEVDRG